MGEKSNLGLIQIFWGDGKGKTTSALGTALRACGSGYKVHLVQFMKNGSGDAELEMPGEIKSLEKLENFYFKRFGAGSWVIGEPSQKHTQAVEDAYNYLKSCFEKDYDIIIADEILYAVQLGLLEEQKVLDLIKFVRFNNFKKEFILTGSHKPFSKIFELADLVTEVKKIKHPFDSGILARRGIEY